MTFEIGEILRLIGLILAFAGLISGGMIAFFTLRGRVGVIEARQSDDRSRTKEGFERIETQLREDRQLNRKNFDEIKATLKGIDLKLDTKADKTARK